MKKVFIADEGFEREFSRNRAKGHKRLVIEDGVTIAEPIEMKTVGTDLVISPKEDSEDNECYTMLCKEFGLVGGVAGFRNKISVIFLDEGWMLVTLLHGALVMNLDGELRMPIVGEDFSVPKVVTEDILWVNAEHLLEYSKYLGVKGMFMYDFEFVLEVGGDYINKMTSFYFRELTEETIDISLGYVAMYEQQEQRKAEAKDAKKLANALLNTGTDSAYDFDDEDEYEDDDDDDDTSYEDYGL